MQQRDPVQWGVWIYLHRAYFTAEILTSFTPLKVFFLFSNTDLGRPLSHPNSTCFPEPLLTSQCNKLDYSFPPLRDTTLKIFGLCEHSMGLFHSSK